MGRDIWHFVCVDIQQAARYGGSVRLHKRVLHEKNKCIFRYNLGI